MKIQYYFTLLLIFTSCVRHPSYTVPVGFISESNILNRPFQVIYAEGTRKIGDSLQLEQLQYLSLYDLVKLENSGYLLMTHFTGKLFEFQGDTILDISHIAEITSQQLNISSTIVRHRTDINLLFQDEPRNSYYQGAVLRCTSYPMTFISPVDASTEISKTNPEICLSWEYSMDLKPKTFEVQIKNLFDEVFETIETENTVINLNLSQYRSEVGFYIVRIYDKDNHEICTPDIGINTRREHHFTPKTCDLNTAVKALEMAYYLDKNRYYFDASEYYELATELSDRLIFTELLNHYRNRK